MNNTSVRPASLSAVTTPKAIPLEQKGEKGVSAPKSPKTQVASKEVAKPVDKSKEKEKVATPIKEKEKVATPTKEKVVKVTPKLKPEVSGVTVKQKKMPLASMKKSEAQRLASGTWIVLQYIDAQCEVALLLEKVGRSAGDVPIATWTPERGICDDNVHTQIVEAVATINVPKLPKQFRWKV